MSTELFHRLYRRLASAEADMTSAIAALDELARLCQVTDATNPSSSERLAEADDCLYEAANSSRLFAEAVVRWLVNRDDVPLAKVLVRKASVRHLQQKSAEAYDLTGVDEERSILAGCRLCALNAAPAVSLGWTLSLAVSYPVSDKARHAVEHLMQYHVDELPRSTRRLLSDGNSPFSGVAVGNTALELLNEREEWHRAQLPLREFAMTPEMRLTLSELKRRENRDILRGAREKSILGQLFQSKHFKYSSRVSVDVVVGNKVEETTLAMNPYSLSVEMPLSEQTDPVAGESRRSRLWKGALQ